MAYSVRRAPQNTKEIQYSNRFAKLLTEDMGLNLEAIGFTSLGGRNLMAPCQSHGTGPTKSISIS